MTTRRQILSLLNGSVFPYSDGDMARMLGRPEPSVRRTRLFMEREGLLSQANGLQPLEWSLTLKGRSLAGERVAA